MCKCSKLALCPRKYLIEVWMKSRIICCYVMTYLGIKFKIFSFQKAVVNNVIMNEDDFPKHTF